MAQLGQYAHLTVTKVMDFGYYLDAGELDEVLLPNKLADARYEEGDEVEVFLYLDSKDKPIATTQKPKATVGQCAYLTVTDTNRFGAFADWGLDKDLMIPFAEQHKPLQEGESYLVYLYIDKVDNRITGSTKIDKFLTDENQGKFKAKQAVNILIANSTDLGIKAVIDHSHWGLIHKSEIFQRLSFGQSKKAFIQHVRPDGRINLTLNGGSQSRDKDGKKILDYLAANDDFAPFHDKSDAKIITKVFGMSKGAFKKAIGGLYKSGEIVIEKSGIRKVK